MDDKKGERRIDGEMGKLSGRELTPEKLERRRELLMLDILIREQNWTQILHLINCCINRLNTPPTSR